MRKYLIYISILITFISLISLGNWQLKRRTEKNFLVKQIEYSQKSPAVDIEENNALYTKIYAKGHFLDKQILLYGRRSAENEKDGYYLLSIFQAQNGQKYLVSRAWLPQSAKNFLSDFQEQRTEIIEAFIMPGERHSRFAPQNDIKQNIWFFIDLDLANELFSASKEFYLKQINNMHLPYGAKPISTQHLAKLRNDHLEYAITWYSLAFALLVIVLVKRFRPC